MELSRRGGAFASPGVELPTTPMPPEDAPLRWFRPNKKGRLMDTPKQEPRWLTNSHRSNRDAVLRAAAETGQSVEWRDKPQGDAPGYGSIWSAEADLSDFWSIFVRYAPDA